MLTPTGYLPPPNTAADMAHSTQPALHTATDMAHSTHSTQPALRPHISLYTILLCALLYAVWHTHGASEGGRLLRNRIAIVL